MSHEDTNEDVGDNDTTEAVGIVVSLDADPDENSRIDDEDDGEETPVEREHLMAQVSEESSLGLGRMVILFVARPDVFLLLDFRRGRRLDFLDLAAHLGLRGPQAGIGGVMGDYSGWEVDPGNVLGENYLVLLEFGLLDHRFLSHLLEDSLVSLAVAKIR